MKRDPVLFLDEGIPPTAGLSMHKLFMHDYENEKPTVDTVFGSSNNRNEEEAVPTRTSTISDDISEP